MGIVPAGVLTRSSGLIWANDTKPVDISKKKTTMNLKDCRTSPKFKMRPLAFSEKFTILRKVIANTLNIELPVRNIGVTVLLLAITLLNSSSSPIGHEFKIDVIVIDAGHGGHDPGTRGKKALEKDVALKIALKLGNYIEK